MELFDFGTSNRAKAEKKIKNMNSVFITRYGLKPEATLRLQ